MESQKNESNEVGSNSTIVAGVSAVAAVAVAALIFGKKPERKVDFPPVDSELIAQLKTQEVINAYEEGGLRATINISLRRVAETESDHADRRAPEPISVIDPPPIPLRPTVENAAKLLEEQRANGLLPTLVSDPKQLQEELDKKPPLGFAGVKKVVDELKEKNPKALASAGKFMQVDVSNRDVRENLGANRRNSSGEVTSVLPPGAALQVLATDTENSRHFVAYVVEIANKPPIVQVGFVHQSILKDLPLDQKAETHTPKHARVSDLEVLQKKGLRVRDLTDRKVIVGKLMPGSIVDVVGHALDEEGNVWLAVKAGKKLAWVAYCHDGIKYLEIID